MNQPFFNEIIIETSYYIYYDKNIKLVELHVTLRGEVNHCLSFKTSKPKILNSAIEKQN